MKEVRNVPKNKWVRIVRKKWFFPALYMVLAAFLLSGVVWYQTAGSKILEGMDKHKGAEQQEQNFASDFDEEAQSVLQQQEIIKMPVSDDIQTEIVTKFYDYNAEEQDQEKGLTLYNNRYYQSTGIDIVSADGKTFDVVASLSGSVTEVKEDPLLGNVVVISHGDSITTYYASLDQVLVETGAKVKQGEKIGTAGRNLFSEESGTHIHFELSKDNVEVNPEQFFNQPLTQLEEFDVNATEMEAPSEQEDSEKEENEKETNKEVSFSVFA